MTASINVCENSIVNSISTSVSTSLQSPGWVVSSVCNCIVFILRTLEACFNCTIVLAAKKQGGVCLRICVESCIVRCIVTIFVFVFPFPTANVTFFRLTHSSISAESRVIILVYTIFFSPVNNLISTQPLTLRGPSAVSIRNLCASPLVFI